MSRCVIPFGQSEVIIEYPMSEDDFKLLLKTLKIWKKNLVEKPKEEMPELQQPDVS